MSNSGKYIQCTLILTKLKNESQDNSIMLSKMAYNTVLDREPEEDGLIYWTNRLKSEINLDETTLKIIVSQFVDSIEVQDKCRQYNFDSENELEILQNLTFMATPEIVDRVNIGKDRNTQSFVDEQFNGIKSFTSFLSLCTRGTKPSNKLYNYVLGKKTDNCINLVVHFINYSIDHGYPISYWMAVKIFNRDFFDVYPTFEQTYKWAKKAEVLPQMVKESNGIAYNVCRRYKLEIYD